MKYLNQISGLLPQYVIVYADANVVFNSSEISEMSYTDLEKQYIFFLEHKVRLTNEVLIECENGFEHTKEAWVKENKDRIMSFFSRMRSNFSGQGEEKRRFFLGLLEQHSDHERNFALGIAKEIILDEAQFNKFNEKRAQIKRFLLQVRDDEIKSILDRFTFRRQEDGTIEKVRDIRKRRLDLAIESIRKLKSEYIHLMNNRIPKDFLEREEKEIYYDLDDPLMKDFNADYKKFLRESIKLAANASDKEKKRIMKELKANKEIKKSLALVHYIFTKMSMFDKQLVNEAIYYTIFEKKKTLILSNDKDVMSYADSFYLTIMTCYLSKMPAHFGWHNTLAKDELGEKKINLNNINSVKFSVYSKFKGLMSWRIPRDAFEVISTESPVGLDVAVDFIPKTMKAHIVFGKS